MNLIEALRNRMPFCDHLSDEELLKHSEGTFARVIAELDVAAFLFCKAMTEEARKMADGVQRAMEHLENRITKIEDDREAEGWRDMGDDL